MKNIHILSTDKPSRLYLTTHEYIFEEGYSLSTDECENKHIYITNDEEIKEGDWFIFIGVNGNSQPYKFGEIKLAPVAKKIILTTDQDLIGIQSIDDDFLEWFIKNPSCEEVDVWINKFYGNKKEMMFNVYGKYKIIIPKEEPKTAWVGVLHDKLNEYYPAEYELKDIYQGEGCLPNFPDEELCQIWCDSKYKEEPNYNMKQEILDEMEKQETLEEAVAKKLYPYNDGFQVMDIDISEELQLAFINGAKWQQQNSYSEEDMKQFGDWCRNGLLNTEYGIEKLDKHLEQWKQLTNK